MYEAFKELTRINLNDKYLGTDGCPKLADFLASHRRVEALQLKCNEITPEGFSLIFQSLRENPNLRYLILEYNCLGRDNSTEGVEELARLLPMLPRLEVLNLANNEIADLAFDVLIQGIAQSRSLKLVDLKFNKITNRSVQKLADEMRRSSNNSLLYVELNGNKLDKNIVEKLEEHLKANRKSNPTDKEKLLVVTIREPASLGHSLSQTGFHKTQQHLLYTQQAGATGGFQQLSRDNMLRNLQAILDQNRKQTAEMKVRMEKELEELQRKEKIDARQLTELDAKCNQLVLFNRNLKFELDRTVSDHQQMQKDHSLQLRTHQERLREANRELGEAQTRYQAIADKMNKEHTIRMKEIDREWDMKIRALEEKIRIAESDHNDAEIELKKTLEKRQRARLQLADEQANVIQRVEEEEAQRYNLRLQALESRLDEIKQARELFIQRNSSLVYQLQETERKNEEQISNLESQLHQLQEKQQLFMKKHKEFVAMNERLTSEIRLKEVSFEKLESEINSLNEQIDLKKKYNKEQVDRVLNEQAYEKTKELADRETQRAKLAELERVLRASQIQNARLRQEYVSLAETVQVNVNRAIEGVFSSNNLF